MIEKVLGKRLNKPLTEPIRKNIDKWLKDLGRDSEYDIHYHWNKKKDKLFVKTDQLSWGVIFLKTKLEIYVEYPFYLKFMLNSHKKNMLKMLKKDITRLMK